MSEDKLNEQARKAYAESQKESDAAHERDVKAEKSKKGKGNKESTASLASGLDTVEVNSTAEDSLDAGTKSASGVGDATQEKEPVDSEIDAELSKAQEKRIDELKVKLEAAQDDLARAHADLYNLQQEYNAYARRTKAEVAMHQEQGIANVVHALMSVLDDIDLARQHGDLEGSFGAVATKLEQALESKFKVKRYGIKGDAFDPALHQAIQMLPGMDGEKHVIDQVAQPGYLMGERVLRPAMVVVGTGNEPENPETDEKGKSE